MSNEPAFETISSSILDTVTGGDNSQSVTISAPIPGTPPIVDEKGSRTDYGYCLDTAKSMGLGASDVVTMCGKPGEKP